MLLPALKASEALCESKPKTKNIISRYELSSNDDDDDDDDDLNNQLGALLFIESHRLDQLLCDNTQPKYIEVDSCTDWFIARWV